MKKNWRVFFGIFFSGSCLFLGSLEGANSTQTNNNDVQKVMVSPLGKNRTARLGSWASLGLATAIGSFLTYKTCEHLFDAFLSYIPFLKSYHQETAKITALTITVPVSVGALMKCGPLATYFLYIVYSGERVSPLLARDALHDVRVYVQHLQTIKQVQKELYEVIDQINNLSESADQKKNSSHAIDAHILTQLDQAIQHDDAYIQTILAQLELFLSQEELAEFVQELSVYTEHKITKAPAYCVAPELQGHTQAIITQLQTTVNSLGDDALLLNNLMKGLVDYWQLYTVSLAEGIDAVLRFCNEVHSVEQIISKWLNRSLLCA